MNPAARSAVEHRRRHGLRVGLDRHLGAGLEAERGADLVEERAEQRRREQRRRAAAEEHRRDRRRARPEDAAGEPDLGERGADVRGDVVAALARDDPVEVAVAADRRAERHVDVHAERAGSERRERGGGKGAVRRRGLAVRERGHAHSVARALQDSARKSANPLLASPPPGPSPAMNRPCKLSVAAVAAALVAVALALVGPALSGAQSEGDLRNRAGQARAREQGLVRRRRPARPPGRTSSTTTSP